MIDNFRIIPVGPLMAQVEIGDGAAMSVLNPRSFEDGGLEWHLRYGDIERARYLAASIVSDYDALTSQQFTMREVSRRLGLLRQARRLLSEGGDEGMGRRARAANRFADAQGDEGMKRHTYRPISEAPRDGTPIVGVCGGVEMPVCWDDPLPGVLNAGWYYWDDEELGPSHERARDQPQEWRELFYG